MQVCPEDVPGDQPVFFEDVGLRLCDLDTSVPGIYNLTFQVTNSMTGDAVPGLDLWLIT